MASAREQPLGEEVSDFELVSVPGGVRQDLASLIVDKKGVVIVFWSAVCSHCRRYDDYLHQFSSRIPDLGLGIIGARENENEQVLAKAVAERGLRFPILHDVDLSVARSWLVCQTPRVRG